MQSASEESEGDEETQGTLMPAQQRTSGRKTEPIKRFRDEPYYGQQRHTAKIAKIMDEDEPKMLNEAINHPQHGEQWKEAIQAEYDSIMKNQTWILTPRPKDRQIVSSKWIFKYKYDESGSIIRFKARLVARGFSQVYGVDYFDTYVPVAKHQSIRILFAIAAAEGLEIHQMDVITAFLAGDVIEVIYMEQPEGFKQGNNDLVCQLRKGLYGLKQGARAWNQKIRRYLKSIGFEQTHSDHCVYINKDTDVILALWVDDLIIFSKNTSAIEEVKDQLRKEFEMKDLGELKYFLGIQVKRDRKLQQIHIDQSTYIKAILKRFEMHNSKPAETPIATGTKLVQARVDDILVDPKRYQSMVGSLMYLMVCTRPDIAYALSQVSQFSNKPTSIHESAVKRIFRYLRHTSEVGLTFSGSKLKLEGYSDADWGASEDRKSISAYIFMLCNAAISWSSRKQSTTALSTTESEYMAMVQALKEIIWIQRLLHELDVMQKMKISSRVTTKAPLL
jgi:hypothetical protein